VIHWWTSGGESAAVKQFADAYNKAGGTWVDAAVAGARAGALHGDQPHHRRRSAHRGAVQHVQAVPRPDRPGHAEQRRRCRGQGELGQDPPAADPESDQVNGHFYAAPVDIHMPAWFFYSKPAFQKAGIAKEPKTYDEFFADLDKLKAAGVVPLALGGQAWQEKITFDACSPMSAARTFI
jgi:glucose/mannose transport system substrate-binding protein